MSEFRHPKGYRFGARPRSEPAKPYLQLARYHARLSPPPPVELVWDWGNVNWGAHLNTQLGDCVVARCANRIEAITYRYGSPVYITDLDCLAVYEAACGYNPNDPGSDQGCDPTIVEEYMQSTGIAGHKVDAYAQVDLSDFNNLKDAVNWFGEVGITLTIPNNMVWGDVWDVPAPGWVPAAGHEVALIGYDASYHYVVTWGYVQKVTEGFLKACCTLALTGISKDMLRSDGTAFNGLNYTQLLADLDGNGLVVPSTPSFWSKALNWWAAKSASEKVGMIVGTGFVLALIVYGLESL